MRRTTASALVAGAVLVPVLWAAPASADPAYPPTGGGGGTSTFTGGGGGTTVTPSGGVQLPFTGTDVATPVAVGAGSVAAGLVLVLVGATVRRRSRHAA